jgi:malate dehydrogenase
MFSVSIVGAGEVGGALARTLAGRERVSRIRLVDDEKTVAAGKALDIQQTGPVESFDVRVTGEKDLDAAVGASVIAIADRAGTGGEWAGDAGLMMLRRLIDLGVTAPLVFAGGSAASIMERAALELPIDRLRLVGSAPEALASAVRALVALEANRSPADVQIAVLGVPPRQMIVPWSDAAIGGFSAARVLDASAVARIERRMPALWPPGPYSLASAAARVVEAIACGSRRTFCCFIADDVRRACAALPVMLGPRGIERVVVPSLDAREQVAFDNAVAR